MNDEIRIFGVKAVTDEDRKNLIGIEDDLLGQSIPVHVILHSERDGVCYDVIFVAEKVADRERDRERNGIRVSFWTDPTGFIAIIGEKIKSAIKGVAAAVAEASSPIIEGAKELITAVAEKASENRPVELAKRGLEYYIVPPKEEVKPPEVAQKPPVVESNTVNSSTAREISKIADMRESNDQHPSIATVEDGKRSSPPSPQQDNLVKIATLSPGEFKSQDNTKIAVAAKSDGNAVSDNPPDDIAYNGVAVDEEISSQKRNSENSKSVVVAESETPKSERPTGLGKKVDLKDNKMLPLEMVVGSDCPANLEAPVIVLGELSNQISTSAKQLTIMTSHLTGDGMAFFNPTGSPFTLLSTLSGPSLANITNMASFYGAIGMILGKESGTPLNGSAGGQTALYASKGDVPEVNPPTRDEGSSNHDGSENSGHQGQQEEKQNS